MYVSALASAHSQARVYGASDDGDINPLSVDSAGGSCDCNVNQCKWGGRRTLQSATAGTAARAECRPAQSASAQRSRQARRPFPLDGLAAAARRPAAVKARARVTEAGRLLFHSTTAVASAPAHLLEVTKHGSCWSYTGVTPTTHTQALLRCLITSVRDQSSPSLEAQTNPQVRWRKTLRLPLLGILNAAG